MPSPIGFGIGEDAFRSEMPSMAEQALASGSPMNNPRVPNADEIVEIYLSMLR
jgi:alcohol dehydrogenase class IV